MVDKKNIILAFGNKEFNNSLIELKEYWSFNLQTADALKDYTSLENIEGFIIHEDALKEKNCQDLIKNENKNKVIFLNSNKIQKIENAEKLNLPISFDQINKTIKNNMIKKNLKLIRL